ncbi:MAG: hypothetical protein UT43_C0006G0007 [Parcubacteria group bacterium GW2011_GWC1_39_29]|nr:MAG: hypothetical protein UT43_C0006G0007 [Parcubacteria group bacterium GW2011_GWC1_39_29]
MNIFFSQVCADKKDECNKKLYPDNNCYLFLRSKKARYLWAVLFGSADAVTSEPKTYNFQRLFE